MPTESCYVDDFFIAGFRCYDGAQVLDRMKAGQRVKLVPQFDNPHDHDAIALKYHGTMLGFVPRTSNPPLAQMIRLGHADLYEARIIQVHPEADPWKQVRVGVYVRDESKSNRHGKDRGKKSGGAKPGKKGHGKRSGGAKPGKKNPDKKSHGKKGQGKKHRGKKSQSKNH